jgi:hypothetical protein
MGNYEEKYADLQEITFWQQLNKQLIAKRKLGAVITDNDQKALQKFCFDNQLFHRITEDPIIDEIPISLVTDLKRIHFLTIYIGPWIRCLESMLPGTIALNFEQAQADAFDAMSDLDKKYHFTETKPTDLDADDDEELFAFISEYNSMVEAHGRELSNALRFLYESKAFAISRIAKEYEGKKLLALDNNYVFLDFRKSQDKQQILTLYRQDFCNNALQSISKLTDATGAFHDMEILGLLDGKESEPNLKQSIQKFIQHERDLILRESKMMKKFYSKLKQKLNSTDSDRIKIVDLMPFAFLKSPYPEV